MANVLLDALHTLGNIVDTPGSVARGLLAAPFTGQWDRPFTGILDPSQRVYGQEWTGNPWTGMAADIVTDPLNIIGGLGLLRTTQAARTARANNAAREALLATGGMPEEIARLTKAVDEAGNPVRYFHGTNKVFDKLDPSMSLREGNAAYLTPSKKWSTTSRRALDQPTSECTILMYAIPRKSKTFRFLKTKQEWVLSGRLVMMQ